MAQKAKKTPLRGLSDSLSNILVPTDNTGLRLERFAVVRHGLIPNLFPRYALKSLEKVDLRAVSSKVQADTVVHMESLTAELKTQANDDVSRSVAAVVQNVQKGVSEKLSEEIIGTKKMPSLLVSNGRSAVQSVHRSVVETVGAMSNKAFKQVIAKTLVLMLSYAREEVGATASPKTALPEGTRFVYYGDPVTLYVVEESPRVRTIMWDGKPLKLSFPYVVFAVYLQNESFNDMRVFFRNEPLTVQDDRLWAPPLPHIDARCRLCFPGPNVEKESSPAQIVRAAQEVFWCSGFWSTGHWSEAIIDYIQRAQNLWIENWAAATEQDPLKLLKTEWIKTEQTVESLSSGIKRKKDNFNAKQSLSKLESYIDDIAERVARSVQEVVLDALADADGPKLARERFDQAMHDAILASGISEKAAAIAGDEITSAYDRAGIETLIATLGARTTRALNTELAGTLERSASVLSSALVNRNRERNNR